jgi:hypothetical protein
MLIGSKRLILLHRVNTIANPRILDEGRKSKRTNSKNSRKSQSGSYSEAAQPPNFCQEISGKKKAGPELD